MCVICVLSYKVDERAKLRREISELEADNEKLTENNKKIKKEYLKVCELHTRTSLKLERLTQTRHINTDESVK